MKTIGHDSPVCTRPETLWRFSDSGAVHPAVAQPVAAAPWARRYPASTNPEQVARIPVPLREPRNLVRPWQNRERERSRSNRSVGQSFTGQWTRAAVRQAMGGGHRSRLRPGPMGSLEPGSNCGDCRPLVMIRQGLDLCGARPSGRSRSSPSGRTLSARPAASVSAIGSDRGVPEPRIGQYAMSRA